MYFVRATCPSESAWENSAAARHDMGRFFGRPLLHFFLPKTMEMLFCCLHFVYHRPSLYTIPELMFAPRPGSHCIMLPRLSMDTYHEVKIL